MKQWIWLSWCPEPITLNPPAEPRMVSSLQLEGVEKGRRKSCSWIEKGGKSLEVMDIKINSDEGGLGKTGDIHHTPPLPAPTDSSIFLFFSHSPLFFILRPQSAPSHKRTSRYHHKGVLVLQRQGQNKTCLLHCSWYFEPGKKAISQRILVEAVNSWDKSKSCLGLAFISFKV